MHHLSMFQLIVGAAVAGLALLTNVSVPSEPLSKCEKWFQESGAIRGGGRECVWKCVAHPVGMGTFNCGSLCDELCGREVHLRDDRYAKGTKYSACRDEYLAALQFPLSVNAVKVSRDRALDLTRQHFRQNRADDESDAFRHFLWSALISMREGPEIAHRFVEAHESCVTEDAAQEMDRHNNQAGIRSVEVLKSKNILNEDEIVKEGLRLINDRKLVILLPRRTRK
jgi:hypothetical protein